MQFVKILDIKSVFWYNNDLLKGKNMSKMDLTAEQQTTFENLQKPTMSLIGSFYEMPTKLMGVFASMMAIYEADPTPQTAKKISDIVMGKESAGVKQARILGYAAKVPADIRAIAKKKYIDEKQSVPAGMPTSGMFLVGFEVISSEEKEALMDAQAACRLLNKTLNPQMDNCETHSIPTNRKLTKMQHLQAIVNHVVDIVFEQSRIYTQELNQLFQNAENNDDVIDVRSIACFFTCENNFIQKAKAQALRTLAETSKRVKNPDVSKKIEALSVALVAEEDLNAQDYKDLIEEVRGLKGAEVIVHHSRQILDMENQILHSCEKSR